MHQTTPAQDTLGMLLVLTSIIAAWVWIWDDPSSTFRAILMTGAVPFVAPVAAVRLALDGAWIHALLVGGPLIALIVGAIHHAFRN